jgi:outer membrane protein OmpA-like peptidoglycan-associated protein
MKRFIGCILLVAAFGVYNNVQAQDALFKSAKWAWGLSGGGAIGGNSGSDKWVLQYRGFLQYNLAPKLLGQIGLGYTTLYAPSVYTAETGIVDLRLLFSPFSFPDLNPYVYGGLGLSKSFTGSGNSFLGMVPFGAGLQTKLTPGLLLEVTGGYNLSLSDKLDRRVRVNDTNGLTGGKQDGFYGFTLGLVITLGKDEVVEDTKKKELAEAEARRVKELAEAEARRVKEQAEAEARLVKQQADADAAAKLAKENAEAEARLLAAQKDTVIVLVKGKTVVLRGVNFEFNKAALTIDSEIILWRAYNAMVGNPNVQIVITGHTDNVGNQEFNQGLSLERAQAVRNWLVDKGIASNRMRTVGRGLNEPVSSNDTAMGRAENRRIEFYVQQ